MSVRERRNRKDSRAKTPEQLHHNRCAICMQPILAGQPTKTAARGSGTAHDPCPELDWPRGRTAVEALQDERRGWLKV